MRGRNEEKDAGSKNVEKMSLVLGRVARHRPHLAAQREERRHPDAYAFTGRLYRYLARSSPALDNLQLLFDALFTRMRLLVYLPRRDVV